jgi:putative transposase
MVQFVFAVFAALRVFHRALSDTALEILALRQQLAVLKRKRPRPALHAYDRLFWTTLRRIWGHRADVLLIVQTETVVGWHRAGFRLYWRWRSRARGGRRRISLELRDLIPRLAMENPEWGAPKIHDRARNPLQFHPIRARTAVYSASPVPPMSSPAATETAHQSRLTR